MRLDLLVNHFVYAAVTDGYLVIFEKDFKRNFIHVRDVADALLHSLENGARMAGRPYNAGLDGANLSKGELALAVKQQVPSLHVEFSEIASDPDKRNYVVSNQRLREAGFEARRSLEAGIAELVRAYRLLPHGALRNA
jgi:nucleoside-diphosphate-sugar epimerase